MSTAESRRWGAAQDRIADDRHERALRLALADPAVVVEALLEHIESEFDARDGLTYSVTFGAVHIDGPTSDVLTKIFAGSAEVARVRFTVEVLP